MANSGFFPDAISDNGRKAPYAFMLGDSPLFDSKQPFKKHHFSNNELPLAANSRHWRANHISRFFIPWLL
jgi:hypothetical protein